MTLVISREQALAYRQHTSGLRQRVPRDRLVEVAYAGLQDSSPRSAVLALHARVRDISASDWEDPQLVQVWGPRGAVYVVPKRDVAVFTLGRLPRERVRQSRVEVAAKRVTEILRRAQTGATPGGQSREFLQDLRRASITGTVRIRWDGSRIGWWLVDPPSSKVEPARLELARRFLRSAGPSTPAGFAWWSGGTLWDAQKTFQSLEGKLLEVRVEGRRSWALNASTISLEHASPASTVRLLPPGDPFLGAADRELLVPEARLRSELWPKSVWPGALFVRGELAGTWRRQHARVVVHPWRRIASEDMEAVGREVQTMPVESKTKLVIWKPPM